LHDVYFGTSFDAVNNATRGNPLGVLVSQGQMATTFDPPGLLAFGQTYYWRVDEVPEEGTVGGTVWCFTAAAGPGIVRLRGYVRDILTGRPITAYDNPASRATLSLVPCGGSGTRSCSTGTDGYYKKWVTEGACYNVGVEAQQDFQTDPPTPVQLMRKGDTIRDFILWPNAVSLRPSCPIYRFQSPIEPYSYYFTADRSAVDNLLFDDPDRNDDCPETRDPDNWEYNGIAFCGVEGGGGQVYRFVCNNTRIPAYAFRAEDLETDGGQVWMQQGNNAAFCASQKPDTNLIAIYRFWSSHLNCYAYVPEIPESEKREWDSREGWENQQIAWYAYPRP
jgi:hypothetical protein